MTKIVFQRACPNPTCRKMIVIDADMDEVTCSHCKTKLKVNWVPKLKTKFKPPRPAVQWGKNQWLNTQ